MNRVTESDLATLWRRPLLLINTHFDYAKSAESLILLEIFECQCNVSAMVHHLCDAHPSIVALMVLGEVSRGLSRSRTKSLSVPDGHTKHIKKFKKSKTSSIFKIFRHFRVLGADPTRRLEIRLRQSQYL